MSSLSLPQKRGRSLYCTRRSSGFKYGVHFLGGGKGQKGDYEENNVNNNNNR